MPLVALPIPNGLWIPARTEAELSLVASIIADENRWHVIGLARLDLVLLWAGGGAAAAKDARPARHSAVVETAVF
jgi:hypothetical protein